MGSEGPVDAALVIVGEAPGGTELLTGRPFVGKAGQLLDSTLARAGLSRAECLLVNSLSCRPTDAPPSAAGIEACRERVAGEVTAYPRKVILTFGNTALRSLTGDHKLKIGTQRGKAIDFGEYGVLVPTVHPAAVLRNVGEYSKMLSDVRYAAEILAGASQKSPGEVHHEVIQDGAHLAQWVDYFYSLTVNSVLACDIETGGYNPRTDPIVCLAIAYGPNDAIIIPDSVLAANPELVQEMFQTANRYVWHNGKFDTEFFHEAGIEARVDDDVMLAHYTLDETKGGHDLAALSEDFLGADPSWKKVPRSYMRPGDRGFENVPREVLYPYAAKDVAHTFQLYEMFIPKIRTSKSLSRLYGDLLIPASNFLQRVERKGIWLDPDYMVSFRADCQDRLAAALEVLGDEISPFWDAELYTQQTGAKKSPTSFNVASSRQLKWVLERAGFPVDNTSEVNLRRADAEMAQVTVAATTGKDSGRLTRKRQAQARGRGVDKSIPVTNALLKAILDWREADKQIATYVDGYAKRVEVDGRIHPTFKLQGTETGRLAASNPNVQNLPIDKRVKRLLAAPPGYDIIELDYSQIELRLLAHFSHDEFLEGVYRDGRDLHTEVALALYGDNYTHQQRVRAKAVNFGIAYGRGAASLAQEFRIPMTEAEDIRQKWFTRSPQATEFIERCKDSVRSGRSLISPFGRRRRFGMITPDTINELENAASNFPMQSTASDLTLYSAMKIQEWLDRDDALDAHVVNLVHDSILIEARSDQSEMIARQAKAIMDEWPIRILQPRIPFPADYGIGPNFGDAK